LEAKEIEEKRARIKEDRQERSEPGGCRENKCEALPPFTGVASVKHEMEEIRGNTAELDKPAGFVLSGVRNEGERDRGIAWSMVIGPAIACHDRLPPVVRSPARSLVRSSVRGNRQSANPRQALALLTSAAGSMD